MKSYFRTEIAGMEGYVPGEQPKLENLCKLNTNENAFPPSPAVKRAIAELDWERLRRYPDPLADALRDKIAEVFGLKRENVIAGNGSDDILTMVFRCFTSPELPMACLYPTYSLYPELAKMQGAAVIPVPLAPRTFELPGDLLKRVEKANLLIITRPNAPTGNSFPLETMRELCRNFDGVVLFDEAYADFADDNCMEFVKEFPNVIVSRTFSKSYALAGLRLGFAVGSPELIAGMFKVKDSYNLDRMTQALGLAAFSDRAYLKECSEKIRTISQSGLKISVFRWFRRRQTSSLRRRRTVTESVASGRCGTVRSSCGTSGGRRRGITSGSQSARRRRWTASSPPCGKSMRIRAQTDAIQLP